MMMKFNFNLSPSAISTFFNSELIFFYQYVIKADPDTICNPVYGDAGNCTHKAIEEYINTKDRQKAIDFFLSYWDKNVEGKVGFNGRPLSKQMYYDAFLRGCFMVDDQYDVEISEMEIVLPGRGNCNFKGFIDLVAKENGVKKICDWKTSSSKDSGNNFRNQVLMYAFLYYKKTGELINHTKIEYLKIKDTSEFEFTDDEIINFDRNVLFPILDKIELFGENPRNYDVGDFKSPFNSHLVKCQREAFVRQNTGSIQCERANNRIYFISGLDPHLQAFLDNYFNYDVEGREYVEAYQDGKWDGKKHFFQNNSLPFAFYWKIVELIDEYNKFFGTTYWIDLTDKRNMDVVNAKYNTKFKESDVVFRYYQEEAINIMLQKKIMIGFLSTSSGKTYIGAELIKRVNQRTIILLNRIELVRQTAKEFEDFLGVKVGRMVQGKFDIDKQITVSSVQTVYAILKRNNEQSRELKKYLYNVNVCICDEVQNVSMKKRQRTKVVDGVKVKIKGKVPSMYEEIANHLSNVEYIIGLSGTPERENNETLEMNSLVGFIGYSKPPKKLKEEGYVLPVKCVFLSCEYDEDKYEGLDHLENYDNFIVNNTIRNSVILDIVEKNRGKHKILILVKSVLHGQILNQMIENSYFLYGKSKAKERKEKYEEFLGESELVMISMTSIMSTGVNIPRLSILINASANRSGNVTVQGSGRPMRLFPGKKVGWYIDFYDESVFKDNSDKRMESLFKYEHEVFKIHRTQWEELIPF